MKAYMSMGFFLISLTTAHANIHDVQEDTIPSIVPLFDPVVVEDGLPVNEDGDMVVTDLKDLGFPISPPPMLRSGTTYKVGTPRTEAQVSSMGAAVWSMAFDVPKGVGDVTPQIGLVYSSQASNGIVGWGVSVSGISCITRGLKTNFYDGGIRGVKYDAHDALFLDGQRMLLSTGTEGTTGSTYVLEGNPYTTVTITSANAITGPLSFEVVKPDGHVCRYGTTDNARLRFTDGGGAQRVHSWYVSREEDPNGNYVEFSYMHDHLTIYPETISYGKNKFTGSGADNYIRFTYTGVQAGTLRTFIIGGVRGGVYKCLTSVRTMTGSSVYRQYQLEYDPFSDGTTCKFERLSTITCKNGAGDEMRPVILQWNLLTGGGHTAETLGVSTNDESPLIEKLDSLFLAADLSGDGLADIVRVSNCQRYTSRHVPEGNPNTWVYIHRSLKVGIDSVEYRNPVKYNLGIQVNFNGWKEFMGANLVTDVDGDGLKDLVFPYYIGYTNARYLKFKCILGKHIRTGQAIVGEYELPLLAAEDVPPLVTGDFDGNGIEDILYLEDKKSNGYYYMGLSFFFPANVRTQFSIPLSLVGKPKRMFAGDFNSDGLPDIIALYDGGHKIFLNNGGGATSSLFSNANSVTGTSFGSACRIEQGDFNGDGTVDFVYVGGNSSQYYFAMGNGDGTFNVQTAINYDIHDQDTDRDDHRFSLIPIDIDRDGMTDLVVSKAVFVHHGGFSPSDEFSRTEVGWLLSDGSSLTEARRVSSPYLIEDAGTHNIMAADFDGDGWAELANNGTDWYTNTAATNDGCHMRVYHSEGFTPSSGRLSSATDGLGATTSFSYGSSSSPDLYIHNYAAPNQSTYPLSDNYAPMPLVSTITTDGGLTGTHSTSYRYKGLKVHLLGKGILGFTESATRDNKTGETIQSGIIDWDTNYYVPSKVYSTTYMGYDRDSTVTTMSVTAHAKSRYTSFPETRHYTDMDGNLTTDTFTYNTTYGYLTLHRTEFGSSAMFKQERSSYVKKGGRWLPQTVFADQKHADDANIHTVNIQYTYDTLGNMLTTTRHPETGMELTTTLTYDSYGNVLSSVQTGDSVAAVTSYTEYDVTGRFPIRRYQSVDSGEETLTYDLWGNVLSTTVTPEPSHSLVTVNTLDGWGDVTATMSPEGVTTTITTGWGGMPSTAYYIQETCPGKTPVLTWYDVRGRESQIETKGPCNTDVVQAFSLNSWGKPSQTVSRNGTRATIEMTAYDYRGRATQAFSTGHGYTYFAYDNRTKSTSHDGRTVTITYDAWGNPQEVIDPACTVTYTYASNGQPSEMDADGSVVRMEYDVAGNRTLLDDPDAGVTTATYAADGKVLTSTDGRGMVTHNTYDAMGRLAVSTCDTLVTTLTYGATGNGKLHLVREETNGLVNEYTYDTYGRVTFDKRIYGDGTESGHSYAYDSLGHISQHVFPSGLTVGYAYDGHGHLQTMTCGGMQVWQSTSFDGWNSVESFGNTNITTCVTQAGQLAERYVRLGNSTTKLHRMAFTWHSTRGNLSSRTGIIGTGITEAFTYDQLDRLTGVSTGGQATMAMTYAEDGNILSKTGLGVYTYSDNHPHAVTGVENTGYIITSTAQQITYNPWGKAAFIEEGAQTQELLYGPDQQRWKVVDKQGGQMNGLAYYHGDYEWRSVDGLLRQFHYLDNGVVALKVGNNPFWYYYALIDNVGSVMRVIDGEGGTAFAASYDAWGKPDVTINQIGFPIGFGGHEMLSQYRLVNMDGRIYDYTLGRFLSPDNYVQEPGNSQSFNRYSYCLNNPLKYTDPTGELFGIDDLIIGVSAFVTGYVANGISTNNWGWRSVQNGLISAGMSLIGWHSGGVDCSAWSIAGKSAASNIVNAFIPSATFSIDRHFSFSISPVFGFGTDGLSAGFFESINYTNGKNVLSIGGGLGNGYAGWKVFAKSGNWGIGYGRTQYAEGDFNGNYLGPQEVGTLNLSFLDYSIGYSNDYFGDRDDRWRTTAAELTIGRFSVGSYVYTNHGGRESGWKGIKWKGESDKGNYTTKTRIPLVGQMDTWNGGKAYYAPLWMGYSHDGNIYRVGMSSKIVHRLTQNLAHRIIKYPAYNRYSSTVNYGYSYYGRHNPLSIW